MNLKPQPKRKIMAKLLAVVLLVVFLVASPITTFAVTQADVDEKAKLWGDKQKICNTLDTKLTNCKKMIGPVTYDCNAEQAALDQCKSEESLIFGIYTEKLAEYKKEQDAEIKDCLDFKGTNVVTVDLQAGFADIANVTGTEKPGEIGKDDNGNCFVYRGESGKGKWYQIVAGSDGGEILKQYAKQLYRFLASVIGLISVLMLIVGGIQITTAGASQDGVQKGKDRVFAALAGLALLFLSGLILYTINPNFFTTS